MKAGSKKIAVLEKICKKTEGNTSSERNSSDNLEKLDKSGKLEEFVRKNNGSWDHKKWIDLCAEISLEGYEPIDFDQVGILLEKYKAIYYTK